LNQYSQVFEGSYCVFDRFNVASLVVSDYSLIVELFREPLDTLDDLGGLN
jgi:hypothetical protein